MLYVGNISEHYKKYLLCEFLDPNFHMGQGLAETRGFVGIDELTSLDPNFSTLVVRALALSSNVRSKISAHSKHLTSVSKMVHSKYETDIERKFLQIRQWQ